MNTRKKSLLPRVLSLALLFSIAGGYLWLRGGVEASEPDPETVRVRRETLDRTVSATGAIRPRGLGAAGVP